MSYTNTHALRLQERLVQEIRRLGPVAIYEGPMVALVRPLIEQGRLVMRTPDLSNGVVKQMLGRRRPPIAILMLPMHVGWTLAQ